MPLSFASPGLPPVLPLGISWGGHAHTLDKEIFGEDQCKSRSHIPGVRHLKAIFAGSSIMPSSVFAAFAYTGIAF